MTVAVLLQIERLSETQRAVRGHFEEGGSITTVVLLMLGLVAIVFLTYLISARQQRSGAMVAPADPWSLFHDLVDKTNLTTQQRRFLEDIVSKAGLSQPAVILLSPLLFDQYVRTASAGDCKSALQGEEEAKGIVAATRETLFPEALRVA